jgi:hypothetical protein
MNIHLVRSDEYKLVDYATLIQFLLKSGGPINFVPSSNAIHWEDHELEEFVQEDEDLMNKRVYPEKFYSEDNLVYHQSEPVDRVIEWEDVFGKCLKYRIDNHIPDDDLVVLLTNHANKYNWFSAGDPSGARNYFIQTGMWEMYVEGEAKYAIAYEVGALSIQSQMFERYDELAAHAHKKAQGCMNDLCEYKPDIRLKLRTADLCDSCIKVLHKRKVDPGIVSQVYDVLDRVRHQFLFRERFKLTKKASRLSVRGFDQRIYLDDLGDEQLRLSPLQRALFLLYLKHPKGIAFKELPQYLSELEKIYSRTYTGGSVAVLKQTIADLVYNEDGKLNEVVSKIKSKITSQLGRDLAKEYIIQGDRAMPRSIRVNRSFVRFEDSGGN